MIVNRLDLLRASCHQDGGLRGNELAVDVYGEERVFGSTEQQYRVEVLVISNHLNYVYDLE